jgi:hypothetical protein
MTCRTAFLLVSGETAQEAAHGGERCRCAASRASRAQQLPDRLSEARSAGNERAATDAMTIAKLIDVKKVESYLRATYRFYVRGTMSASGGQRTKRTSTYFRPDPFQCARLTLYDVRL